MPGAGYNIPVSVSDAQTYSVPQNTSSPTYFVFGSAGASVGAGENSQQANPNANATATSSAAEGNAAASTQATANPTNALSGSNTKYYIIGAAILATGLVIAFALHKRK